MLYLQLMPPQTYTNFAFVSIFHPTLQRRDSFDLSRREISSHGNDRRTKLAGTRQVIRIHRNNYVILVGYSVFVQYPAVNGIVFGVIITCVAVQKRDLLETALSNG